jgi:hypothetical protein
MKRDVVMKEKPGQVNIEIQKIELIRLRIKNKYYDREEILLKVVQEMYEHDIKFNPKN